MKKVILAAIAGSIGMITTSCGLSSITNKNNGPEVSKEISITDSIKTIATYGVTDIEYTQGPCKATLYAPEKRIGDIIIETKDGVLSVSMKDHQSGNLKSRLVISAPNVSNFISAGTGDIDIKGIEVKELSLTTSGTGDIDLQTAKCTKLTAVTSGVGDIDIKYLSCVIGQFTTSGTGDIDIKRIVADRISGTTNGVGDISVSGECKEANLTKTGIGSINDKGLEISNSEEE